jgi:hypothetical protein
MPMNMRAYCMEQDSSLLNIQSMIRPKAPALFGSREGADAMADYRLLMHDDAVSHDLVINQNGLVGMISIGEWSSTATRGRDVTQIREYVPTAQ